MKYQLKQGVDREEMRAEIVRFDQKKHLEAIFYLFQDYAREPQQNCQEWDFPANQNELVAVFSRGRWSFVAGDYYTIDFNEFKSKYFDSVQDDEPQEKLYSADTFTQLEVQQILNAMLTMSGSDAFEKYVKGNGYIAKSITLLQNAVEIKKKTGTVTLQDFTIWILR